MTGESSLIRAYDVITLSPVPPESRGSQIPQTEVHYKLEVEFKGLLRPFIGLIQKDLNQLGREAMNGLTKTCFELFGDKAK